MNSVKNQPGKFGRPLVPFFLDTTNLVENVSHELTTDMKRQQTELLIPKDAKMEIRKFSSDGYFEYIDMPLDNVVLDTNLHKVVQKGGSITPIAKRIQSKRDEAREGTRSGTYNFEDLLYPKQKTSPMRTQNPTYHTEEEILQQYSQSHNDFVTKSITESELLKQVAPTPTKKTNFAGSDWENSPPPSSLPLPKFK
jgi:hypothetical protein